jgi:hypothetical protein
VMEPAILAVVVWWYSGDGDDGRELSRKTNK